MLGKNVSYISDFSPPVDPRSLWMNVGTFISQFVLIHFPYSSDTDPTSGWKIDSMFIYTLVTITWDALWRRDPERPWRSALLSCPGVLQQKIDKKSMTNQNESVFLFCSNNKTKQNKTKQNKTEEKKRKRRKRWEKRGKEGSQIIDWIKWLKDLFIVTSKNKVCGMMHQWSRVLRYCVSLHRWIENSFLCNLYEHISEKLGNQYRRGGPGHVGQRIQQTAMWMSQIFWIFSFL